MIERVSMKLPPVLSIGPRARHNRSPAARRSKSQSASEPPTGRDPARRVVRSRALAFVGATLAVLVTLFLAALSAPAARGAEPPRPLSTASAPPTATSPSHAAILPSHDLLAAYFQAETARLADACLTDVKTLADWTAQRPQRRAQLFEMLGLSPPPERTNLRAVVTGREESEFFTAEKLHFQSVPGLYVTANFYLPKERSGPVPAILYVCGHSLVASNGISYGNKTYYQHHGEWFARHGYACLILDTLQLGEIQGIHHGTYREGMWWWNSRGYTPAGVEAWNGIRALDYLATRPEVDASRLGVTGRSGGGAYSWTIAALDDRIKVAAPIAGITDLENYVVGGAVEGHCDCMFFVNTYRWDYPLLAALIAPRPLLLGNSDKDGIFPLDGVERLHRKVKHIYELYGATNAFGLLITDGPHQDTQDLQVPVFRWFNRHLKNEDPIIDTAATRFFPPEKLRVFTELPPDQLNTRIQDRFVPAATAPAAPETRAAWETQRAAWLRALREEVFRGWPAEGEAATPARTGGAANAVPADPSAAARDVIDAERNGLRLRAYEFMSQASVPVRIYLLNRSGLARPRRVTFEPLDESRWAGWLAGLAPDFGSELAAELAVVAALGQPSPAPELTAAFAAAASALRANDDALAFVTPRGVGLTAWPAAEPVRVQLRRRFMLLGQTLDGMRVWDIQRALRAARVRWELQSIPLFVAGSGSMGVNALYASLFAEGVAGIDLGRLPASQAEGPDYLNVLRFLDLPAVVALAAERAPVRLHGAAADAWAYPAAVTTRGWWTGAAFSQAPD